MFETFERKNIFDIEGLDGVLSQYFSGLNSLDILVQPPFGSDSFQVFRCRESTFKFLYGIKQFHYPQLVKSSLTCNFSETGLFLRIIITIPF